jgi:hypothetical protein
LDRAPEETVMQIKLLIGALCCALSLAACSSQGSALTGDGLPTQ